MATAQQTKELQDFRICIEYLTELSLAGDMMDESEVWEQVSLCSLNLNNLRKLSAECYDWMRGSGVSRDTLDLIHTVASEQYQWRLDIHNNQ